MFMIHNKKTDLWMTKGGGWMKSGHTWAQVGHAKNALNNAIYNCNPARRAEFAFVEIVEVEVKYEEYNRIPIWQTGIRELDSVIKAADPKDIVKARKDGLLGS